jgi:hypothetical protein
MAEDSANVGVDHSEAKRFLAFFMGLRQSLVIMHCRSDPEPSDQP